VDFLKLMRPKHYIKNALVFVPVMYAGDAGDLGMLLSVIICFTAFCFAASGIYVVNDIFDKQSDAVHPVKRQRPVASGRISVPAAAVFAAFLIGAGVAFAAFGGRWVLLFLGLYIVLNLAYSFKLKHFVIIDCFCVAAGFVIRIYAGGAAVGAYISEWLFLTITAGSLFMAFGKRRGDKIKGYNAEFLNGIIFACASLSVVFYALWAMAGENFMIFTVPLFIFILCKYLLAVYDDSENYGDPVSLILGDKVLICAVFAFAVLSFVLLYCSIP